MPKKRTKKSSTKKRSSARKVAERKGPIPKGYGTVTPYLTVIGAAAAIDFYKRAFGAKEVGRSAMPDGKILNATLDFNGSKLMLSDEFPGSQTKAPSSIGATTVTLHLYSEDVDKLWEQALAAGAKIVMPLDNQFWAERYGQVDDPFGHRWSMSMRIEMKPEEIQAKRQAAMAMFSQGEYPRHESEKPSDT